MIIRFIHRSIFWKIFLWVAAIILMTVIVVTGVTAYIIRDAGTQRYYTIQARQLAPAAVAVYEIRGRTALRHWFSEIEQKGNIEREYSLLDAAGHSVLPDALPPKLKGLRGSEASSWPDVRLIESDPDLFIGSAVGSDGSRYYLVTEITRWYPWRIPQSLFEARGRITAYILLIFLLAGTVLFFAARQLISRPVNELRKASSLLSQGDFSARVSEKLRQREDEIAELAGDFDTMAERLQRMLLAHRQLLRDVSHELRSPLARIQAALGLVRQKNASGIEVEVERIERECSHLDELIGGLLSLSKLEAQTSAAASPMDLASLVSEVAQDSAFEAEAIGRTVVVSRLDAAEIAGDEELLRRAIDNVVRNAVRWVGEGGSVEVSLVTEGQGRRAIITVSDNGPGVAPEKLETMFEPFVRSSDASINDDGGFGLGLAIARRAILLHGGSIAGENRPEGGLVVRIHLPLRRA